MRKCKFCDHRGCTERGEEVCTKLLLYIGDDKEELPCKDFSFSINSKHIIIAIAVAAAVLTLLISCI